MSIYEPDTSLAKPPVASRFISCCFQLFSPCSVTEFNSSMTSSSTSQNSGPSARRCFHPCQCCSCCCRWLVGLPDLGAYLDLALFMCFRHRYLVGSSPRSMILRVSVVAVHPEKVHSVFLCLPMAQYCFLNLFVYRIRCVVGKPLRYQIFN